MFKLSPESPPSFILSLIKLAADDFDKFDTVELIDLVSSFSLIYLSISSTTTSFSLILGTSIAARRSLSFLLNLDLPSLVLNFLELSTTNLDIGFGVLNSLLESYYIILLPKTSSAFSFGVFVLLNFPLLLGVF